MPLNPEGRRGDHGLQLTLVRHGHAESPAAGDADFDRVLDRRGLTEVRDMARHCLARGDVPQLLRASAAARTRQTAAVFAQVLDLPADRLLLGRELYLADLASLLETVRSTAPDVRHLMLVGHNPGMIELAQQLAWPRRVEEFATAAIFCMRFAVEAWQDLRPGTAVDAYYRSPADLPDLRSGNRR
ncbi:MAG: histidine phosphatase family protein [Sinobacteraceae bacterium]|nr:histidine phosphatase family protein [Nevskiaceae bacterium]MCP5340211.1 histidine phosphatase family protein [Nevskiaceae bacterium]MCP5359817.1 histidine phosphatase family protein [Nevskiaceae bacterium]